MKKHLLSALALTAALAAYAALPEAAAIERVQLPDGITADQAVMAPDGTFIIAATLNDNSLNRIDLSSGAVRCISDDGIALGMQISDDGRNVVYRKASFDASHRRHVAVMGCDLTSGRIREIAAPARNLQGFRLRGSQVAVVADTNNDDARTVAVASISHGALCVTIDGVTRDISPQGTEGNSYLWPEISPDGTRVSYYLATVGAFTCNLDGSDAKFVGVIRAPRWYGNDAIIGMVDRDNGRVVTESSIVAAAADGSEMRTLTGTDVMAMYPSASADGSKITFTTPAGELYIITVKR